MSTNSSKWKSFLNLLAFIAIVCIGVALLVNKILGGNQIGMAFQKVAEVIAYSLTAVSAFFFVRSKGTWPYYVVWAVGVVLIIVLMIL